MTRAPLVASLSAGGTFLARVNGEFAGFGRPGSCSIASRSFSQIGPKIPMSSLPSPSQSPTTGRSSASPSFARRSSWSQRPLWLISINQYPSLKTAISSDPSPSKSPASGVPSIMPKILVSDFLVISKSSDISVNVQTASSISNRSHSSEPMKPTCCQIESSFPSPPAARGKPPLTTLRCQVYSSPSPLVALA